MPSQAHQRGTRQRLMTSPTPNVAPASSTEVAQVTCQW